MSESLDPIFVVDFSCFSFLSQSRRARSRDLINFAGWHQHLSSSHFSGLYSQEYLLNSSLNSIYKCSLTLSKVHLFQVFAPTVNKITALRSNRFSMLLNTMMDFQSSYLTSLKQLDSCYSFSLETFFSTFFLVQHILYFFFLGNLFLLSFLC